MKMKMNKWIIFTCVLSYLATVLVVPSLPQTIANHWGINGAVNGYADKSMYYWLGALPLVIYLLMLVMPKIDPRRKNYELHHKAYAVTQMTIVLFMVLINWVTIAMNLGAPIPVGIVIPAGLGVLFIVMGNYMGQIRPNYFFGIKTPWTLANETVWKKTHKLGAYLFMGSGVAILITLFLAPIITFGTVMVTTLGTGAVTFVYSYLEFRKISQS